MFLSSWRTRKDANVFSIPKIKPDTNAIPVRYHYVCRTVRKIVAGSNFTTLKPGGRNDGFKLNFNGPD